MPSGDRYLHNVGMLYENVISPWGHVTCMWLIHIKRTWICQHKTITLENECVSVGWVEYGVDVGVGAESRVFGRGLLGGHAGHRRHGAHAADVCLRLSTVQSLQIIGTSQICRFRSIFPASNHYYTTCQKIVKKIIMDIILLIQSRVDF